MCVERVRLEFYGAWFVTLLQYELGQMATGSFVNTDAGGLFSCKVRRVVKHFTPAGHDFRSCPIHVECTLQLDMRPVDLCEGHLGPNG
jgi:hypothetical protein